MAGCLSLGSPLPSQVPEASPSKRFTQLTHARWSPDGWLIEYVQSLAIADALGAALETIRTAHPRSLITGLLLIAG